MDYNTDLDKQTLVGIMAEVFDDINNDEIWDAYIDISDAVRHGSPQEIETYAEMTTMNMREQLRWRHRCQGAGRVDSWQQQCARGVAASIVWMSPL